MKKILHYPNLQTVLMVEKILKKEKNITRTELKKKLPKKVMHQTLNVIIKYLEDSGKVIDHKRQILWTYCPPEEMAKIRKNTIDATELFRRVNEEYHKTHRAPKTDAKHRTQVRTTSRTHNRRAQQAQARIRV